MKQLRSTLILLALALGIGGYIYFNERGPAAQEGNTVLLRTNPDTVQTVQLREGNTGVQFSRSGQGWQVARVQNGKLSFAVPADDATVKTLLAGIELVQSDTLVNGGNVKAFGLDKPRQKLRVDGQNLEFGISPSFEPNRVYARVGQRIALVPSSLVQNFAKPFDAWRDKYLMRFDTEAVTAFQLQTPALNANFQKEADTWKITKPLAVTADTNAVSSLLSTLSTPQISQWLDDKGTDAAKWGLDKPTAKIQVGDATLTIGKKQTGGYAARNNRSPSVFLLPQATFENWNKPLDVWRTKTIVELKPTDITQMVLTARGASKTLVKSGERWSLPGGTSDDNTNSRALDVVYFATGLQATRFIDKPKSLGAYGLDKPEVVLAFTASQNQTLKIGRAQGQLYASLGGPTVYSLNPDALEAIQIALDVFFPRPKPKTATAAKK